MSQEEREGERERESKVPCMYKPWKLKLAHFLSVVIRMLFCETWSTLTDTATRAAGTRKQIGFLSESELPGWFRLWKEEEF